MLEIEAVNHVGIRVRDKSRSISFYESLGFALVADAGFAEGHVGHVGVLVQRLDPQIMEVRAAQGRSRPKALTRYAEGGPFNGWTKCRLL